jgi:hypothetical protein
MKGIYTLKKNHIRVILTPTDSCINLFVIQINNLEYQHA